MTSLTRQTLGALGEDAAVRHLERLGYRILERRHRTRFGELDVIAADENTIVFVEVKARRRGDPWQSLHAAKRAQVRRMAAAWLASPAERPFAADLRFDAIGVTFAPDGTLQSLEHLEGAF